MTSKTQSNPLCFHDIGIIPQSHKQKRILFNEVPIYIYLINVHVERFVHDLFSLNDLLFDYQQFL